MSMVTEYQFNNHLKTGLSPQQYDDYIKEQLGKLPMFIHDQRFENALSEFSAILKELFEDCGYDKETLAERHLSPTQIKRLEAIDDDLYNSTNLGNNPTIVDVFSTFTDWLQKFKEHIETEIPKSVLDGGESIYDVINGSGAAGFNNLHNKIRPKPDEQATLHKFVIEQSKALSKLNKETELIKPLDLGLNTPHVTTLKFIESLHDAGRQPSAVPLLITAIPLIKAFKMWGLGEATWNKASDTQQDWMRGEIQSFGMLVYLSTAKDAYDSANLLKRDGSNLRLTNTLILLAAKSILDLGEDPTKASIPNHICSWFADFEIIDNAGHSELRRNAYRYVGSKAAHLIEPSDELNEWRYKIRRKSDKEQGFAALLMFEASARLLMEVIQRNPDGVMRIMAEKKLAECVQDLFMMTDCEELIKRAHFKKELRRSHAEANLKLYREDFDIDTLKQTYIEQFNYINRTANGYVADDGEKIPGLNYAEDQKVRKDYNNFLNSLKLKSCNSLTFNSEGLLTDINVSNLSEMMFFTEDLQSFGNHDFYKPYGRFTEVASKNIDDIDPVLSAVFFPEIVMSHGAPLPGERFILLDGMGFYPSDWDENEIWEKVFGLKASEGGMLAMDNKNVIPDEIMKKALLSEDFMLKLEDVIHLNDQWLNDDGSLKITEQELFDQIYGFFKDSPECVLGNQGSWMERPDKDQLKDNVWGDKFDKTAPGIKKAISSWIRFPKSILKSTDNNNDRLQLGNLMTAYNFGLAEEVGSVRDTLEKFRNIIVSESGFYYKYAAIEMDALFENLTYGSKLDHYYNQVDRKLSKIKLDTKERKALNMFLSKGYGMKALERYKDDPKYPHFKQMYDIVHDHREVRSIRYDLLLEHFDDEADKYMDRIK